MEPKKILFLCTHNSARSQMAEAIMNKYYPEYFMAFSAGTDPAEVNPFTKLVLQEENIPVDSLHSKHANIFINRNIDIVVTVCDHAKETCPFFPYAKEMRHHSFPDPSSFQGTEDEKIQFFRKVRDQIKTWLFTEFNPENQ